MLSYAQLFKWDHSKVEPVSNLSNKHSLNDNLNSSFVENFQVIIRPDIFISSLNFAWILCYLTLEVSCKTIYISPFMINDYIIFLLIRLQKITENSHVAIFGFKSCFFFAEFTLLPVMWFLEIRKIVLKRRFNFQVPNKQFSLI